MPLDDESIQYFRIRNFRERYLASRRRSSQMFLVGNFICIVIAFIWGMFILLPPVSRILNRYEQILGAQLEGMQKIPDLTAKLQKLDNQLALLSTESVDARLQTLEKALHAGGLKPEDIATLLDLKQEVETLKTYMFRDPKELVELKALQQDYRSLEEGLQQVATKDMLRSEISTLQTILMVSLTIFGILFTVFFGSWWFVGRRKDTPTTPLHPTKTSSSAIPETEEKP